MVVVAYRILQEKLHNASVTIVNSVRKDEKERMFVPNLVNA